MTRFLTELATFIHLLKKIIIHLLLPRSVLESKDVTVKNTVLTLMQLRLGRFDFKFSPSMAFSSSILHYCKEYKKAW